MPEDVRTKILPQLHALTDIVSKTYDIGECKRFEPLTGGLLNRVYLVTTSRSKYVLKEHRYYNSAGKLHSLKSLLDQLKLHEISCDYIVPTRDGEFFFEFNDSKYIMHKFIPGTNYTDLSKLNGQQRTNAIEFLVQYHSAVWGSRLEGESIQPCELPVVFTDNIGWIRRYISSHQNVFDHEEDFRFVMGQTDKLDAFVKSKHYQDLPRLLVHGDYRFCNVVFTGNKVAGLFDWDLLQCAPRVFEVVDACSNFALDLQNMGEDVDSVDRFADFKRLLTTYQRAANHRNLDLSAGEIAAIPEMLRLKSLQTGINFAILLRQLPLRPGETEYGRINRSQRCLHDALETLRNIDDDVIRGDFDL